MKAGCVKVPKATVSGLPATRANRGLTSVKRDMGNRVISKSATNTDSTTDTTSTVGKKAGRPDWEAPTFGEGAAAGKAGTAATSDPTAEMGAEATEDKGHGRNDQLDEG